MPENNFLSGDQEYIEEYFKICELYQNKRIILIKKSKDDVEAFRKNVSELDSTIKTKEVLFWQRVQDSMSKGSKFALEKTASLYGLDIFEKQILLYYLYLEFLHLKENICSRDLLLRIFDLNDSVIGRMGLSRYFNRNANLLKYSILYPYYRNNHNSAVVSFGMSSSLLDVFSRMISGEYKESRPGRAENKKDLHPCEEVGFLKDPAYSLEDVKLSLDVKKNVSFLLSGLQDKGLEDLGVEETIKNGKGLVFLFYGPPGTGKSMLSEAIAKHLKKKLLVVEFPKINSRWFGETDKQISSIFKSAKQNNVVICIDEADSILYNRNFAAQEHDIRFVNIMLQEIERFEGVVILTSNMDNLLDPALERRVTLKVKFDLPDEKIRKEIWRSHIPSKVTLAQGVDFAVLARQFQFSGGYIKNAVFHALRRLVQEKRNIITMNDLLFGASLEQDGIFVKDNKTKIGFFANS
ncbi:MAG: ATP-binding protein [Candidatus Omnitrophica bacterium]|nr:ATP-binding protein [Candidatus Omnitrophota bacterium]